MEGWMRDQIDPTPQVALQLLYALIVALRGADPVLRVKIDTALDDCASVVAASADLAGPDSFEASSTVLLSSVIASIRSER
jgi:hypothetical protein